VTNKSGVLAKLLGYCVAGQRDQDQQRVFQWAHAVLSEAEDRELLTLRNKLMARAASCESLHPGRAEAMREVASLIETELLPSSALESS
jgi:hypothetical protein